MILKVKQNENPYDVIGNYIEKHIPIIDDIIAVISINGEIRNELLLVDVENSSINKFVWQIDWWEGEENVELIDFFFVSDACKKNNNNDLISGQAAIDALEQGFKDATNGLDKFSPTRGLIEAVTGIYKCYIKQLPSIQPRGKWIPSSGQCNIKCSECGLSPDDFCYSIDYIELDYAPNFCPNCGADMRGEQK